MTMQARWQATDAFSEMMYMALEADCLSGQLDLDAKMRRLKDLSAYSLSHAEIMDQGEGPELLALGKFFGMASDARYHKNRERLALVTREATSYRGRSENVEREVGARKKRARKRAKPGKLGTQPKLL